jgi:hypothetical protein
MIQRKQNYLLILMLIIDLTLMLTNLPIFTGVSIIDGVEKEYSVNFFYCHAGSERFMNTYLFVASNVIAFLIAATIKSYKNLQHQLTAVRLIFVVLIIFTFLTYFPQGKIMSQLGEVKKTDLNPLSYVIFIFYILNYLAFRGIKKDIELLASADRLR